MKKITIFASGSGSNAENIVQGYFKEHPSISVDSIKTNNAKAGVINRAKNLGVPCHIFKKTDLNNVNFIAELCKDDGLYYFGWVFT